MDEPALADARHGVVSGRVVSDRTRWVPSSRGCRAVPVPSGPDGGLDLASISPDDAARALLLWVNSPSNPTGALDDLGAAADWGRTHGVPVFSDECYVEFTWTGRPRTILERGSHGVVAVHSLSKRSNLAGLRVGFYAGDAELVHYLQEVRKHVGMMVPGPAQAAGVAALDDDTHVEVQRERYRSRLERMAEVIGAWSGTPVALPAGAFYLWIPAVDGWDFAERLAADGGVLVSPGEFYGDAGRPFVRVAVVQPDDRIELVERRFARVGHERRMMSTGTGRRRGRLFAGIVVVIVGVAGAFGLWFAASARLDAAVEGFARGPVGCDTVLDFDETGDYLVFIETKGQIDASRGDCSADSSVDWSGADLPTVTVTLTDPDGTEVDISNDDGVDYDAGGSQGSSIGKVAIEQAGDHLLRVESDDDGFFVSIGRNPNDGVALLRVGALALLVAGVVVGGLLIVSSRRRAGTVTTATDAWTPMAAAPGWPSSPPGFPAPPPTTGVTGVVGSPSGPPVRRPGAPLPMPPGRPVDEPSGWGPPGA